MKNLFLISVVLLTLLSTCKRKEDKPSTKCFPDLAFSSIDEDLILGQKLDSQILATPSEYPILDPAAYPEAYNHLMRIVNNIKASGKVVNESKLAWNFKIIRNDETLNAFCTPGGYIYVYTGIIKYLETEDDFAGVIGHEIAHADLRHTAKTMTQQYGLSMLSEIVLGQSSQSTIAKVLTGLSSLSYSRCHETQADEFSVRYLSGTKYKCNGAASFFEKISAAGGSGTPQFLSTHPDPGNRVIAINETAKTNGCNTSTPNPDAAYASFKNSLP